MLVPNCPKCKVEAVQKDAGFVKSSLYWMCPTCKDEVQVAAKDAPIIPVIACGDPNCNICKGETSNELDEDVDLKDFLDCLNGIDKDDDDLALRYSVILHSILTTKYGPPYLIEALYDRKNEALEILTDKLGVEYNKATKIIFEVFEQEGWHDVRDNSNNSDVLGSGNDGPSISLRADEEQFIHLPSSHLEGSDIERRFKDAEKEWAAKMLRMWYGAFPAYREWLDKK